MNVKLPLFFEQADKLFAGNTTVADFKACIDELRQQYFNDIARVRTISENEVAAEQAAKEKQQAVRSLFEAKRAKASAKIKNRQSAFMFGASKKTQTLVKTISRQPGQDDIVCAVSREVLGSGKTYFAFATYHMSNVGEFNVAP